MTVLKVGQRLWWLDKKKNIEGYVIVADITEDQICVWYNGKIEKRSHSVIGKKLFLTPQLSGRKKSTQQNQTRKVVVSSKRKKTEYTVINSGKKHHGKNNMGIQKEEKVEQRFFEIPEQIEKSCDTCALRKNGTCTSLQNQLCEEYKRLQYVSAEERNAYPQYGDASAIRRRDRRHFK